MVSAAEFAALLLAGFSLVTAGVFHGYPGNRTQQIMVVKIIAMAGSFLLPVDHGTRTFRANTVSITAPGRYPPAPLLKTKN